MSVPTSFESKLPDSYVDIQDHSIIGNMRTAALISTDGIIEQYCVPHFDSPSVFCRHLDINKGGHFSIRPLEAFNPKQGYIPSTNVLSSKFLSDNGVANVIDFIPLQSKESTTKPLLHWLVRKVEVTRGQMTLRMECAPAFNYARDPHETSITDDDTVPEHTQMKAMFSSKDLSLDLRYTVDDSSESDGIQLPHVQLGLLDLTKQGHLGLGVYSEFTLKEGQSVTFILRLPPKADPKGHAEQLKKPTPQQSVQSGVPLEALVKSVSQLRPKDDPMLDTKLVDYLLKDTVSFWRNWIGKSTYRGSWREAVHRSALALKLLIFEPTGAIVASPTFSLPEALGGPRNWDYRYSWIRDSSFTLYALIRLGFTKEASAFVEFIFGRLKHKNPDGSLQIMYTIHGDKEIPELELEHLDGHKQSRPVRIGNGAADHVQLDIYGELMDCIYLGQKYGAPLGYDRWLQVRDLVDYVVQNCHRKDLSIWEVRSRERHFTYSKVMLWVALDRGLRLADKRSLPCPHYNEWRTARDNLYEQIMEQAWNKEKKFFCQSYEDKEVLDSAVLVMPLVFFCDASEPRFRNTLTAIMRSPEKGGLLANNLVFRYNAQLVDDGVGGEEGAFSLCTLWAVEALSRGGRVDQAVQIFEEFLAYGNHTGLFSEEISAAGEGLGNAVQGFTHVTLISAAFNLSRTLGQLTAPGH
ncbi:Six-hairpin glycosidase [Clavulina sp. PMI_390]|nr:Six-hairpin glycosidase [Clavulina sp. PMI_390]